MQQESMNASARSMKQISSSEIFNSPPYSSIFFHTSPSPTSFAAASSTSDVKSSDSITATAATSLSRMMSEHKELLNHHALCLSQLRKTFKESETLRQENTNLRLANAELSNQVNLLIQATLQNQNRYQMPSFLDQYGSSSLSEKCGSMFEKDSECGGWSEGFSPKSQSPINVMEKEQEESEKDGEARVTLPKSISIRSNGYLKINPSSAGFTTNNSSALRIRASSPVNGPQKKVYVRGGSKKDGPIELEVYNQGMFKTELCNKWQETGSCPYGDHCQFAHGIKELRPVIRHPRYKTEVCRMVLAGDPCPYGHRCHFRHALTDEEKLMLPLRLD